MQAIKHFMKSAFKSRANTLDDVFYIIENTPHKICDVPLDLINQQDEEGWSPLMFAAFCRQNEVVEYLIQKGANIKFKNSFELTAYDYAYLSYPETHEETLRKLKIS
jgi:hypothetical protein